MHLHDDNARRQLAAERVDELARDFRRAQKAEERQRPDAEHRVLAALLRRRRRRRPARVAAQRP
jgi:hypothetical protein